jgi:caffeoyl-CoA O-methyltransferase
MSDALHYVRPDTILNQPPGRNGDSTQEKNQNLRSAAWLSLDSSGILAEWIAAATIGTSHVGSFRLRRVIMRQMRWIVVGFFVTIAVASDAQAPRPERPGEPGRRGGGGRVAEGEFDAPPVAKSDAEKKVLATLEEMKQGPRFLNVSTTDGRLLRIIAESVGAKNIVEIGTSTGESSIWFALALRSTGGHLFTHEIDAGRAQVAQENFKKAGVDDLVTIIVGDAHETVKQHKDPIDVLFLDADKEGYIDYLEKLLPLVRPGGLIIAHNMNARMADPNYVKAVTTNPDLETLILLKEGAGIGVTMKKR